MSRTPTRLELQERIRHLERELERIALGEFEPRPEHIPSHGMDQQLYMLGFDEARKRAAAIADDALDEKLPDPKPKPKPVEKPADAEDP
jgi:hypothetical protein